MWIIPGKLDEETGKTVVAPELEDCFTMNLENNNGVMTLSNYEYVALHFMGSWDMPFSLFRLAGSTADILRNGEGEFAFNCLAHGNDIEFYGRFLKFAGLSDRKTGFVNVAGDAKVLLMDEPPARFSGEIGMVLTEEKDFISASLTGFGVKASEHIVRLLLVDAETGLAVPANYARETEVTTAPDGTITEIKLMVEPDLKEKALKVYLMIDTHPVEILTLE